MLQPKRGGTVPDSAAGRKRPKADVWLLSMSSLSMLGCRVDRRPCRFFGSGFLPGMSGEARVESGLNADSR